MRRIIIALVIGVALVSAQTSTTVAKPKKPKKQPAFLTVGTDPAGDWGDNTAPGAGAAGDPLNADLINASIGMKDSSTVSFIIGLKTLSERPRPSSLPTAYLWGFTVNGELFELQSCTADLLTLCQSEADELLYENQFVVLRYDDANGAFIVTATGVVEGRFDSSASKITIDVPLHMLAGQGTPQPRSGTKIDKMPDADGLFSYSPVVYSSNDPNAPGHKIPRDSLTVEETYVIP